MKGSYKVVFLFVKPLLFCLIKRIMKLDVQSILEGANYNV